LNSLTDINTNANITGRRIVTTCIVVFLQTPQSGCGLASRLLFVLVSFGSRNIIQIVEQLGLRPSAFDDLGGLFQVKVSASHFRSTPINGHHQTDAVGPVGARRKIARTANAT
jgi:hypothetical protein